MRLFILLLLLIGCKKNNFATTQTDSLNLTGDTGRNLTIQVFGLDKRKSKTNEHRICAFGLAGNEVYKKGNIDKKLSCSSEMKNDGTVSVTLKHLPYPAYITLFHDENLNSVLDFATFDIVIAKKQGPIEGTGFLKGADTQQKYSRPIWVEVGESQTEGYLQYENSPFWKYVSERIWDYCYGWYLEKAFQVNHPSKQKNPFCTKAEECL